MTLSSRETPVTLNDGKKHTVHFDINRLADLEDEIGTVVEVEMQMRRGSLRMLRAVLRVGMDEGHTDHEVGELMVGAKIEHLFEVVSKALNDALEPPASEKGSGKVGPRKGAGEATAATPSPISSPPLASTG